MAIFLSRPAFPRINPAYPMLGRIRAAWFHLGDHLKFVDIVGRNNGAPTSVSRAITPWGRCSSFTRSTESYYQLARVCDIHATDKITIATTVYFTDNANQERSFIGTHGRGGDNRGYFFKYSTDDSGSLAFFLNESWSSATLYTHQPCAFFYLTPIRFVLTYDGSATAAGVKFYQNGSILRTTKNDQVDTLTTSATPINGNTPWIGAQENNPYYSNIDGSEDALIFWDRVLSAEEIAYDYLNPFGLIAGKHNAVFMIPAGPTTLTVAPSAIDSTASIGSATAAYAGSQPIAGTGIGSTAAFGSATLSLGSQAVSGTGIGSTASFGSASVSLGSQAISGTGIGSTLALGSATVSVGTQAIAGTGIGSTASFGSASVTRSAQPVVGTGIDSTAGIGAPTVAYAGSQPVTGTGIDSTLAFGTTSVTGGAIPVSISGIDSTESEGSPNVSVMILNTGPVRRSIPGKCRYLDGAPRSNGLITALVDYSNARYMLNCVGSNNITFTSGVTSEVGPYGSLPYFGTSPGTGSGSKTVSFLYNKPFTVSLTARVSDTGSNRCVLACYNSGSAKGWEIYFNGNTGYFDLFGGSGIYFRVHNANFTVYSSLFSHRVSVTYSGNGSASGIKFYQDGAILSGNVTDYDGLGTASTVHTNPLMVGHSDTHNHHYGTVGDILIWNRELNASEVASDYGDPFAPICPHRLNIAFPYTFSLGLAPSGIDSTAAMGSASIAYAGSQSISGTGISSTAAFGTAALSLGSIPVSTSGIDSTAAFGGATVGLGGQTLVGSGIAPTAAFGSASVQREVSGTGIGSTTAFGTTLVYLAGTLPVLPSGIDSTSAVGSPVLIPHPYMGPVRHFILPTHPHLNLAHPRSRGLVGAWPYYAMKRTYDLIGGNHVDFQNATFGVDQYTNLGKLPYSSSTYGTSIKRLDFGPTQPFSIAVSGYIHPSSSDVYGTFVANYYNNAGYSVGLTISGGASSTTRGPRFYFGSDSTGARIILAVPYTISKGVAYRFLYTYDGSCDANNVSIYVNGVKCTGLSIAQNNLLTTSTISYSSLLCFNKEGQYGNTCYGLSGNVIIWNRVLTSVEAQEDYNDTFGMFRARRPNLTIQHTPEIIPASIASTLAFGSAVLTRASLPIVGTGIDSAAAVGSPDVALGILHLAPEAIDPESAVGSPVAMGALAPAGIASTLTLGTPATGSGLAVPAIEPTTAIGSDTLTLGSLAVAVSGIGSTYASGVVTVTRAVAPTSIGSTSSVSSPIYVFNTNTASPDGIGSTLTIGEPTAAVQPWSITLAGWGPTGTLGSATVNPFTTVAPDSIASGETVDIPLVPLTPFGIASTAASGLPRVDQPNNLQPDGIQPTESFGAATFTQSGTEYLYGLGADSTVSFGDFATSVQQTLAPSSFYSWYSSAMPVIRLTKPISATGIDSTVRFGTAGAASGLLGTGIDSTLTTGVPSVAYAQAVSAVGIGSRAQAGTPAVSSTLVVSVSTIEVIARYGEPALWRSQAIAISGISSRTTAGVPTVAGSVPVSAAGIDPTSDVGAPAVAVGVATVRTPGIASSTAVASPSVARAPLAIATDGITPTEILGGISVGYSQVVSVSGIASRTTAGISALGLSATLVAGQIEPTSAVPEPVVGIGVRRVTDVVSRTSTAAVGTPGLTQSLGVAVAGISGVSDVGTAGLALGVYPILGSGIGTTVRMVGAGISIVPPAAPVLTPTSAASATTVGTPSAVEYEQFVRVRSIATTTAVPEPYVARGAPGVPPVPAYPTAGVYGATRRILAGAWKTQIRMSGQYVTIQATDGRGKWWDMPGYVNVPALVAQASAEDVRVSDLEQPTYRWELRFDRPVPLGPANRVRYTDPTRGSVFIYTGPASDVSGLGVVWSARGDDTTGSVI